MATLSLPDIFRAPEMRERLLLVLDSHRRLTGRELVEAAADL